VHAAAANQGRGEGVRHYEATILGDERDGKRFWDGKIETIGKIAIFGPLAVGTEIGDRAFDLYDRKFAATTEGKNIGSPPIGERELKKARKAELFERAADAAGEKRCGQRFINRRLAGKDGITVHREMNKRGIEV
jgi:hypothetical protein